MWDDNQKLETLEKMAQAKKVDHWRDVKSTVPNAAHARGRSDGSIGGEPYSTKKQRSKSPILGTVQQSLSPREILENSNKQLAATMTSLQNIHQKVVRGCKIHQSQSQ